MVRCLIGKKEDTRLARRATHRADVGNIKNASDVVMPPDDPAAHTGAAPSTSHLQQRSDHPITLSILSAVNIL